MKTYTLWLWEGNRSDPVDSARSIQTARKKACGILRRYGYGDRYIEILDDTSNDYPSVGTITRYPIKGREFIWTPLRYSGKGTKDRYIVLPDGDIKAVKN